MDGRWTSRSGEAVRASERRALAAALVTVAALAASPARAADRYLAVLEFSGSSDRFVLEALAERARSVASDALRGSYLVITRDNVVSLLRQNRVSCDALDASCSVDLGRAVGADLVLSGRIRPVEDRLEVGLQLHETVSGALVASDGASVATPMEALDRVESLSRSVLRQHVAPPGGNVRLGFYGTVATGPGPLLTALPHQGDVGCSDLGGGSRHPCTDSILMGATLGRRTSARRAYELSYRYFHSGDRKTDSSNNPIPGSGGGFSQDTHTISGGLEWTPFDARYLALAVAAGPALYRREVADAAPPFASSSTGWSAGAALDAEARVGFQLKFLQLGLRLGVRLLWAGKGVSSPDGTRRAEPGLQLEIPIYFTARIG
jgi:hypothetical protein